MSIFAISDLHLSLGTDKPMDVFQGWDNYVEKLKKNWEFAVKDEDTVVIAGDISWAMKIEECFNDFQFINSLPGKKIFLKGNHDLWWGTKRKVDDYLTANGFNTISVVFNNAILVEGYAVCGTRGWMYNSQSPEDVKIVNREVGRLKLSLNEARKIGGKPLVFLHYPPSYDVYSCKEIIDTLKEYGINDCYYGHIHGTKAMKKAPIGDVEGIKMHLISCDYLGFFPKLIF